MIVEYECNRCGSSGDFEEGVVQSGGTISFRPKATKFLQLSPRGVDKLYPSRCNPFVMMTYTAENRNFRYSSVPLWLVS